MSCSTNGAGLFKKEKNYLFIPPAIFSENHYGDFGMEFDKLMVVEIAQ